MKLRIKETNIDESISQSNQSDIIDFIEIKFKDGRSKKIDTSNLDDALDSLNRFLKTNNNACDSKFSRRSLNLPKN